MNFHSPNSASHGRLYAGGLPTTPRMVYWPASPDLAPYISGYHLYAVAPADGLHRDAFQPAWANLRVVVSGGERWRVRPVRADWVELGPVSLFGPSSALTWSESPAGVVVGAGIRPRGWLRLFACSARDWADRIDPAPPLSSCRPETVHARFCALDDDEQVPHAFEALFREVMRPLHADDAAIGRIEAALVDPAIDAVSHLAQTTGLSVRTVERLARRAFGFPPKLLLRRARFLRSLDAIRRAPASERAKSIDAGYTDYSHFIRDSHDFLGLSPQSFLEMDLPLLKQSLVLRKEVLGASAQALARSPSG